MSVLAVTMVGHICWFVVIVRAFVILRMHTWLEVGIIVIRHIGVGVEWIPRVWTRWAAFFIWDLRSRIDDHLLCGVLEHFS